MDVVCGRCRAEYEFDNALISERGTTVRCTSCGLQFKIFPPLGQRALELWRVFRAEHLDQPVLEYASLEELQRGIAAATVRRTDWLARGDDVARPLAEILELQPLLGQRNSERPPQVEDIGPDAPGVKAVLRLGSSGTVIGMPPTDEDDMAFPAGTPPPAPLVPDVTDVSRSNDTIIEGGLVAVGDLSSEAHNALVEKWVEPAVLDDETTVVVPSLPPEESGDEAIAEQAKRSQEELVPAAGSAESLGRMPHTDRQDVPRRKVRSALSHTSAVSNTKVRPQRASLLARTRIGGSQPVETEPPSSGRRSAVSYPPPLPEGAPDPPVLASDPTLASAGAEASLAERVTPAPLRPSEVSAIGALQTPVKSSHVLFQPDDRDQARSGAKRGQVGRDSSSKIHREEMASTPGTPPRKATFSVVVVLVFATAGGFLVWSRVKSPQLTGASQSPAGPAAAVEPAPTASSPSASVLARLVHLESAWWINLLKQEPTVALGESVWTELSPSLDPGPSWERVNLLRLAGNLGKARELAMQLPTAGADYALAALDLIETDHPPWALLSRRFKDASVGESAPYFARVGFIYSLTAQGSILAARAEYENLSKMQGANRSSLFNELGEFLRRAEEASGTETSAPSSTEAAPVPSLERSPAVSALPSTTPAPTPVQKAPQPAIGTAVEETKKKKDVPADVKAKVDQADQLWRSGDRDGAVVLYRQVVAQIGTSHFLGQRSAARVAQAAREANGEPQ